MSNISNASVLVSAADTTHSLPHEPSGATREWLLRSLKGDLSGWQITITILLLLIGYDQGTICTKASFVLLLTQSK